MSPARRRIAPRRASAGSRPIRSVQLERAGVDAEPLAGRPRPVVEDVTEVPAAGGADDLLAHHPVAPVEPYLDGLELGGLDEARPARAGVELRLRAEELRSTPGAAVHAGVFGIRVRPRERTLGRLLPQHGVLLGRQPLTPLLLAQLDLAGHRSDHHQ